MVCKEGRLEKESRKSSPRRQEGGSCYRKAREVPLWWLCWACGEAETPEWSSCSSVLGKLSGISQKPSYTLYCVFLLLFLGFQ
jgi:hypothetical protein